jgi:hypothetical protein
MRFRERDCVYCVIWSDLAFQIMHYTDSRAVSGQHALMDAAWNGPDGKGMGLRK